jgi:transcriptional/translational regulatory protein YebC/TACO1
MGGGDVNGNPRLRKAVEAARGENMPADNITKAIKRGTGELEGVSYEEITYEGTGPGGTLFLVDVLTDNRNRTVAEIRKIFEKAGGVMGASGTASWAFERKGQIRLAKKAASEEQLFDVALGAGAEDIADEGEEWLVTTPATRSTSCAKGPRGREDRGQERAARHGPEEPRQHLRPRRRARHPPRREPRRPRRRAERLVELRPLRRRDRPLSGG